jgi:hypothetical protein
MKNIHVLPTDKSSRLYLGNNGNFVFGMMQTSIQSRNDDFTNQNIYITSDEEIKEGDWTLMFDSFGHLFLCDNPQQYLGIEKGHHLNKGLRKIILTTDQNLIKDGVQEIDDEFLEWFVKNPSCDTVKIESWQTKGEWDLDYKIIITKDLIQVNQNNPVLRGSTALIESYKVVISKEEPKQETLEEFSKRISNDESNKNISLDYQDGIFYGINVGAKWQAERMYSEEDLKQAFSAGRTVKNYKAEWEETYSDDMTSCKYENFKEWFQQFKKK